MFVIERLLLESVRLSEKFDDFEGSRDCGSGAPKHS